MSIVLHTYFSDLPCLRLNFYFASLCSRSCASQYLASSVPQMFRKVNTCSENSKPASPLKIKGLRVWIFAIF